MAEQIESWDLASAAETAASIPSSGFQAFARADLALALFRGRKPESGNGKPVPSLKNRLRMGCSA
jgi:hypothetical protein